MKNMTPKLKMALSIAALTGTLAFGGTALASGDAGWQAQILTKGGKQLNTLVRLGNATQALGNEGAGWTTIAPLEENAKWVAVPLSEELTIIDSAQIPNKAGAWAITDDGKLLNCVLNDDGKTYSDWTEITGLPDFMTDVDYVGIATGTGTDLAIVTKDAFFLCSGDTPQWTKKELVDSSGDALAVDGNIRGVSYGNNKFLVYGTNATLAMYAGDKFTAIEGLGAVADDTSLPEAERYIFGSTSINDMVPLYSWMDQWYVAGNLGRLAKIKIDDNGLVTAESAMVTDMGKAAYTLDINAVTPHYFAADNGDIWHSQIVGGTWKRDNTHMSQDLLDLSEGFDPNKFHFAGSVDTYDAIAVGRDGKSIVTTGTDWTYSSTPNDGQQDPIAVVGMDDVVYLAQYDLDDPTDWKYIYRVIPNAQSSNILASFAANVVTSAGLRFGDSTSAIFGLVPTGTAKNAVVACDYRNWNGVEQIIGVDDFANYQMAADKPVDRLAVVPPHGSVTGPTVLLGSSTEYTSTGKPFGKIAWKDNWNNTDNKLEITPAGNLKSDIGYIKDVVVTKSSILFAEVAGGAIIFKTGDFDLIKDASPSSPTSLTGTQWEDDRTIANFVKMYALPGTDSFILLEKDKCYIVDVSEGASPALTELSTGLTSELNNVWGEENNLYVSDKFGNVVHFDGTTWEKYGMASQGKPVTSACIFDGGTDIIGMEEDGPGMHSPAHVYNLKSTWKPLDSNWPTHITGVGASAACNGTYYVSGLNERVMTSTDGISWEDTEPNNTAEIKGLAVIQNDSGEKDSYQVGKWGLYRWTVEEHDFDGEIFIEKRWKDIDNTDTSGAMHDITLTAPGKGFVAAENGLFTVDGDEKLVATTGWPANTAALKVMAQGSENIFAIGKAADNTISLYSLADGWSPIADTPAGAASLFVQSPTEVYVGGTNGVIKVYNGNSWSDLTIAPAITSTVADIWSDGENVYAVTGESKVYRHDGTTWNAESTPGGALRTITGIKGGKLIAGGDDHTLVTQKIGFSSVTPSYPGQAGVEIIGTPIVEENTAEELQENYNMPEDLAPVSSTYNFKALTPPTSIGVFGITFTPEYNIPINKVGLRKLHSATGTTSMFTFTAAATPGTEKMFWLAPVDSPDAPLPLNGTLETGKTYTFWFTVRDVDDFEEGAFDADITSGVINDPVVPVIPSNFTPSGGGGGSSSGDDDNHGCVYNPAAPFSLEWLLLLLAPVAGLVRNRFRKQ